MALPPEAFTPNVGSPCRLPSLLLLLPLLDPLLSPEQSSSAAAAVAAQDGLVSPLGREAEVLHGEVAVGRRDLVRASEEGKEGTFSGQSQTARANPSASADFCGNGLGIGTWARAKPKMLRDGRPQNWGLT